MQSVEVSLWIEAIGWMASFFTVVTYAMNTMLPLRIFAVASSVFFMIYAAILQIWPLFGMEVLLLPINGYRLWQIISVRQKLASISEGQEPDFSIVRKYGKARKLEADTVIFERGDRADQLYYIAEGNVFIEDHGVKLATGDIFGEIAFFTPASTRTATAKSLEGALVYELDKKRFMRLQFEDPSFGLAIMQMVTSRLIANGAAVKKPVRSKRVRAKTA